MGYQSRFGRERWLQPYAEPSLWALAESGVKQIDVVCPGFATDCLETLEEVAMGFTETLADAARRCATSPASTPNRSTHAPWRGWPWPRWHESATV
jgi:protoheme ferro-lyase